MSPGVKARRAYHSPRRQEGARSTRQALLDAARDLFIERGYVATTIASVARAANLSNETVYAVFGSKRALLAASIDVSIAGGVTAAPILEQPWVQEMRGDPDGRARLRILAHHGAGILERRSALDEVVRGAARADPEIAELWQRLKAERFTGQRALLRIAIGDATLRDGQDLDTAAAVLFAIGSPETYQLLVVDRGWTPSRFASWYADTLERLLL